MKIKRMSPNKIFMFLITHISHISHCTYDIFTFKVWFKKTRIVRPLSVSVKRRMNREWKRSYLNNRQQTETRIQMIKMVNEFNLTVVHFARPKPMQICACAWIYRWTKKTVEIRTGPPGLRAAGRGPAFNPIKIGRTEEKTFLASFKEHLQGLSCNCDN